MLCILCNDMIICVAVTYWWVTLLPLVAEDCSKNMSKMNVNVFTKMGKKTGHSCDIFRND